MKPGDLHLHSPHSVNDKHKVNIPMQLLFGPVQKKNIVSVIIYEMTEDMSCHSYGIY